ncbi:MAG: 4Fe-4S binding protein [Chloroflexota bacterium]
MSTQIDLPNWQAMPAGGVVAERGNSTEYETGSWRALRPVVDMDKCTHCMICWIFCPDISILVQDMRMAGFDLAHCKGCGICAAECPVKAITMVNEERFREEG